MKNKLKNLKGVLALLLVLYVISSSNGDYGNTGRDMSTVTEIIDRGRVIFFNSFDSNKRRKKNRVKDMEKKWRKKK